MNEERRILIASDSGISIRSFNDMTRWLPASVQQVSFSPRVI